MKKFLVVYKASQEEFTKIMSAPKEEQQKLTDAWKEWMGKHKADMAEMGGPVGKTKEVSGSGVKDIKNDIGAYDIVQAESHDAAAKIFTDSPHLTRMHGTIEIMEIVQMPGM